MQDDRLAGLVAGNLAGWIAFHLSCLQSFCLTFWQDRFLAVIHASKMDCRLSFMLDCFQSISLSP